MKKNKWAADIIYKYITDNNPAYYVLDDIKECIKEEHQADKHDSFLFSLNDAFNGDNNSVISRAKAIKHLIEYVLFLDPSHTGAKYLLEHW